MKGAVTSPIDVGSPDLFPCSPAAPPPVVAEAAPGGTEPGFKGERAEGTTAPTTLLLLPSRPKASQAAAAYLGTDGVDPKEAAPLERTNSREMSESPSRFRPRY